MPVFVLIAIFRVIAIESGELGTPCERDYMRRRLIRILHVIPCKYACLGTNLCLQYGQGLFGNDRGFMGRM